MNLSGPSGNDDSSSDESAMPSKRPRADTYGASSSTSHGSVLPESDVDDEVIIAANAISEPHKNKPNYDYPPRMDANRLSQSSVSENCSSPNDTDDFQPGFDNEIGNGDARPSFQSNDSFYNKSDEKETNLFNGEYSEKSKRMMSNMGYKSGKGLGKHESGRVEPIEASSQKGRRGLGLKPSIVGEIPRDFRWNPDDSKPEAKEEVTWMPKPPEEPVPGYILEDWLKKGSKKLSIHDETQFVEPEILKGVLESKTIFDTLDDEDLRKARFRSNPYETIGSVIFLNRAAVKMANIDAVFDFMFTKPKTLNGESAVDKKGLLYFADVCAGPGGFSEYVLYRKGWKAKGFGFTLKGKTDFKLSDFYAGPPETFNPFYGVNDDGNIFNPENLTSLKENVLKNTDDKGVHFLMADGGFSVEGQENLQEILSKQLYLCQCLAALMLVRTGGHFVVKLFDVFTLFSVGLVYIMYRCFEKVSIHKPVTSRPANSERYLVCQWKKLGTEPSEAHLYNVNEMLWRARDSSDDDVTQLVPLTVIQEDAGFFQYIYKSNCVIGDRQIKHLLKIAAFSKDKNLNETTQSEMKEQCLQLWQLPDKMRTQPDRMSPDDALLSILSLLNKPPPDASNHHAFKTNTLNGPPKFLERTADLELFKNVYDWHFMVLSCTEKKSPDLKWFICCGGKQLHQLDGYRWKSAVDLHITMPAKTLVYGEIVKEYRGEGNTQMYTKALHIIDALMLGGVDISRMNLTERINQCALFCAAVEKPFDSQAIPVRCKKLFNMESFPTAVENLEYRAMKRIRKALTIRTPNRNRDGMFYVVGSLMFFKEIKEPWIAQMSRSSGLKYYFCTRNKKSEYHIVEEAGLDTIGAFMSRVMWLWESPCAIMDNQPYGGLTKVDVESFIRNNVKR